MELDGYACNDLVEQGLPGGALLIYQSFSASAVTAVSPRSILHFWEGNDVEKAGNDKKMIHFWECEEVMEEKNGKDKEMF